MTATYTRHLPVEGTHNFRDAGGDARRAFGSVADTLP
jgi:hypothetical protein